MLAAHTADLHLSLKAPERLDALREVILLVKERSIDLLLISGDMFDTGYDAEQLRPSLRELFSRAPFNTLILPGNHDYQAFREGLYFGEQVTVVDCSDKPWQYGEFDIWGLPFQQSSPEELAGSICNIGYNLDPGRCNILLYHGELLDSYFARDGFGEEGDRRYMPVKLSYFREYPFNFVLAGHFHSRYAVWPLSGGGYFVYPGSPVSVTRRELGRRGINLIKPGAAPQEILLNSFHYEELNLQLSPLNQANPLVLLKEKLKSMHPSALLKLTVEGLYNGNALGLTETELAREIRSITGEKLDGEPVEAFSDIGYILADDLFTRIRTALMREEEDPEITTRAINLILNAFRMVK